MRNTKSAFTLVELIVVITILAILGTIAFISLQGYSADARNSKRTSDLGNIQSALSLKQVEGVPLMSFVDGTSHTLDGVSIAGTGTFDNGIYAAGIPSYAVLNVVKKDFLDPQGDKDYALGATEKAGGVFQLAATMEIDGVDTALVNGTFVARGSGVVTGITTDVTNGVTLTVPEASANFFKKGDVVTGADGANIVAKVSRDGQTVTLTNSGITTTLALTLPETSGITSGVDTDGNLVATGIVSDDQSVYLPY